MATQDVLIKPRGLRLHVHDGETILDAARRHGYTVAYSCRQAVCRAKVLRGQVHYADDIILAALSLAEMDQALK